ncbi:MAG: PLP-dependent transferase [Thalassobaculum sp.]
MAVHSGASPDPATGARDTPIYQTTAYVFDDADHAASLFNLQTFGNIYSRLIEPDRRGAGGAHRGSGRRRGARLRPPPAMRPRCWHCSR